MENVKYAVVWLISYAIIYLALLALRDYLRERKWRNNKNLRISAGVTLKLTDDEVALIINGEDAAEVILNALDEGRFEWGDDIHISDEAVQQFNIRYGTNYRCSDHGIDFTFDENDEF